MTKLIATTILFAGLFLMNQAVFAQTTEFTYQGSLKDGASAATGNYDFEFALFDSLAAGSQIGSTLTRNTVAVAGGTFAVKLDFGGQFPGSNRFLEIRVRVSGGGAFTPLLPRQLVNSAPYSVKALSAATAVNATNLGGVAASQFVLTGDARLSDARDPLPGSSNYIRNNTVQQAGSFNIDGTGTANIINGNQINVRGYRMLWIGTTNQLDNIFAGLNAGQATSTGVANSFFGTNSGQANSTGNGNAFFGWQTGSANTTGGDNTFVGGSPGTSNTIGSRNSFIGRLSGSASNDGNDNAAFGMQSMSANTSGSRNTILGASSGASLTSGNNNTALGYQADVSAGLTNATALGNQAKATTSNSMVLGSINGVNGAGPDTNVGIGITAPTSKLHVNNGDVRVSNGSVLVDNNVGIGTPTPAAKLHVNNGSIRVTNGGIFIANPNTLVITSPNGACWGITVNNTGGLATFSTTCP